MLKVKNAEINCYKLMSLEDTFFEKPHGGHTHTPSSHFRVKYRKDFRLGQKLG